MLRIADLIFAHRFLLAALSLLLSATGVAPAQTTSAVEDAKAKAVARLTAAERAKAEVQELQQHADYALAASRDANLTPTWQRAEQLLQTAQDALRGADATPSANAYRDAGILANGSRRAFEDVVGRIQRKLRDIAKERQPPEKPKPTPEPQATDSGGDPSAAEPSTGGDAGSNSGAPPVAPAAGGGAAGGGAAGGGAPAETSPSASDRQRSAPRLPATSPSVEGSAAPRLTSAAPPLRQAIEAFFRGDDLAVLEILNDSQALGRGEQQAHALMLRSAARYHLYLLGGEKDYAQRSAAVEDAIASHRLSPGLAPSRDLFSPRFVDFFNNTH